MRDGDGQWVRRFWGGYESGRRITHTRLAEAVCKGAGVDERGRSEGESENWGEEAHAGYDSEYLWRLGGIESAPGIYARIGARGIFEKL